MIKSIKQGYDKVLKIFSGYFTQLLIFLILLFTFRPYDRGPIYIGIWQAILVFVFISAIYNCNHTKPTKIISAFFAFSALVTFWIDLVMPSKPLIILSLVLMIIFIFITTISIVMRVVINARVKMETLKGVVCAYFMVAFGFSFIFVLIEFISPQSFNIASKMGQILSHSHYLSEMMYFSFVTLLTIGYGDISALKDLAQTCSILEGIIGQFYIAILVSRLVAVYSFFEHKLHLTKK